MTITLTWRKLHTTESHTETFDLENILTIGRSSRNSIVLDDRGVSRQHALIGLEGERLILTDSSTNGTWMHAQAIKQSALRKNTCFQIMSYHFKVVAIEVPKAPEAHKPTMEDNKPSAVQPAMDLVSIIKTQPFIENLLDLIPNKEEA